MINVSLQEANAAIGSLDSAYYGVLIAGYYMPKKTSSIITTSYIMQVMTNKVFRVESNRVRIGQPIQKIAKSELLDTFLEMQTEKPFGFDQDHHPDKQWMINILFTINQNHFLFQPQILNDLTKINADDIKMIRTFNTSMMRNKAGRFFKRSKSQILKLKEVKQKEQELKKIRRIEKKTHKMNILKKQILDNSGLSQPLQQIGPRISQE